MITGIPFTQYLSNKNSNDEILNQTIARMIAYDVQSSDVIETAVATESSISTFVSKNTTTLF